MDVNLPGTVAEVRAAFTAYERALVANDVERLVQSFWDSEHAVRYGIGAGELQYGSAAIEAWRRVAAPVPAGRTLGPTAVASFGRDLACVSTEFRYPGDPAVGRQSQTWVRLPEGWRIAAAHVSVPRE